jgi:hypothetical protein
MARCSCAGTGQPSSSARHRAAARHHHEKRFPKDYRVVGHVVDYVHLNPVRTVNVPADQTALYPWSSMGRFVRGSRCHGLTAEDWLKCDQLDDTAAGWSQYQAHLVGLAGNLE